MTSTPPGVNEGVIEYSMGSARLTAEEIAIPLMENWYPTMRLLGLWT